MVGTYRLAGASEHLLQTDFPIRAPWQFPAMADRLVDLVHCLEPDIIHSHFVGSTLTMRLALGRNHRIPRVFQVPGPLHLEHLFFRRAEIATASIRDYWIGSCKWTCQRYKDSGIKDDRIFLSYYGSDLNHLQRGRDGYLRNELAIPDFVKLVGMIAFMYAPKRYLGQIRGLKGHEDLIDAFKICLEQDPNIRCIIVGGAWNDAKAYEEYIHSYARQQCGERVIFLGTRKDIADIYTDFDVAVHPSHSENVGGAGESCVLGVPTIATRVGGFPDVVQDGITGWLVPPRDPPALANAILEVLSNPLEAAKRAQAGQQLANRLFDVVRTAMEVAEIYQTICSRGRS
jgi:glycosyltransferase involved in cell wall biosynthesis